MSLAEQSEPMRRQLDESDLERMRLPLRHWESTLSDITAGTSAGKHKSLQAFMRDYLRNLGSAVQHGTGLAMYGSNGVGKSGAAACIVKEAVRQYHTALFMPAAKLRTAVIQREAFDEQQTIWERAMEVDVLVLDDLGKGTSDSKGFLQGLIDDLVRTRSGDMKVTIITTNMTLPRMVEENVIKQSTLAAMQECMIPLPLTGPDKRQGAAHAMLGTVLK